MNTNSFRRYHTLFGSVAVAGNVESGRLLWRLTAMVVSAIMVSALLCGGCASRETTAYRTLGVTANLVDGAMNGWGDWVRAGRATTSEQAAVRYAYERYQATMAVARKAVVAAKTAPAGTDTLATALKVVESNQASLVNLIGKLVK